MKLKPCPFCGSTDVYTMGHKDDGWYARCNKCSAEGPTGETDEKAKKAWNTRQKAKK